MPHYFTDCLPPKELLSEFPNWRVGGHTENRPGCHEETIWNCGPYKYIDEETDLTAGDVYYADGSSRSALIGISDNHTIAWATELRIYSDNGYCQIEHLGYDPLLGTQGSWRSSNSPIVQHFHLDNETLLPMKYCTNLRSSVTKKTISGGIEPGGGHFHWDAWEEFAIPKKKRRQ